jgi:hypothetical protein
MLVLQCAFHDFDSQLAQRVGDFQYVGCDTPTITFRRADGQGWDSKAENRLRAPELKTASGAIAVGSTGDYEITEIKNGKGHLPLSLIRVCGCIIILSAKSTLYKCCAAWVAPCIC